QHAHALVVADQERGEVVEFVGRLDRLGVLVGQLDAVAVGERQLELRLQRALEMHMQLGLRHVLDEALDLAHGRGSRFSRGENYAQSRPYLSSRRKPGSTLPSPRCGEVDPGFRRDDDGGKGQLAPGRLRSNSARAASFSAGERNAAAKPWGAIAARRSGPWLNACGI